MNNVEGFFAVGAIIGPSIVARLLVACTSWKWLYVIAGTICVVLIVTALLVRYPETTRTTESPIDLKRTLGMMNNPYALGFSAAIFLYVAVECAVYVWMPTLLATYHGPATYMATMQYRFSSSFGRPIHRIMDTRPARLDRRGHPFQPGDCCLLPGQRGRGNRNRGLPAAVVRTLHVRHLSHDQLEGHQLLPKD
jgi:MFS family permease